MRLNKLLNGTTQSCGCLQRDKAKVTGKANLASWSGSAEGKAQAAALGRVTGGSNRIHQLSRHPLYGTWWQMMSRCYNQANPRYPGWGGRGIRVCDRWHDVALFIADIEQEIGPRPEARHLSGRWVYTLDRTDNDGNYEPGKVRWATAKEQQANSRRAKRHISSRR